MKTESKQSFQQLY